MKKSITTTRLFRATAIGVALLASLGVAGTAAAGRTTPPAQATVTWTGNGTTLSGVTRTLNTEICDATSTPYLLWVLSGSKAASASINIDGGGAITMGKPGIDKKTGISTFKYTMPGSIGLDTANVVATYNDAKNKATLTISHGCLGAATPALTVVFLGELLRANGNYSYGSLGSTFSDTTATTSVCETSNLTNCATFNASAPGTAPSTSRTLTMSATGIITLGISYPCIFAVLFDTAVTPAGAVSSIFLGEAPTPIAFAAGSGADAGATTGSYSNADTVYIVTVNGC